VVLPDLNRCSWVTGQRWYNDMHIESHSHHRQCKNRLTCRRSRDVMKPLRWRLRTPDVWVIDDVTADVTVVAGACLAAVEYVAYHEWRQTCRHIYATSRNESLYYCMPLKYRYYVIYWNKIYCFLISLLVEFLWNYFKLVIMFDCGCLLSISVSRGPATTQKNLNAMILIVNYGFVSFFLM